MKPWVLMVIPHTHWDREWYEPFEAMRARLVRTMDRLLDVLDAHPDIPCFLLDGQTICLDDYLEVRPERRPDVERLVRAGRLVVGPNYVLPDEFLIGLESHVRNLMLGIRSARAMGRSMMVGYYPDSFGHITHLPAILRGFGIDAVVIWRGVGEEATTSEFRWASPDGSQVLAIHLPYGYALGVDLPDEPSKLRERLQYVWQQLTPLATTRYLLLPNGDDHRGLQEDIGRVVALAKEVMPQVDVVIGDYGQAVDAIKAEVGERILELPLLEGEFRSPHRSHVLPGVLSSRMWIKQRYQECEDLLCRWAEPLVVWARLLDAENPRSWPSERRLLAHAWRLLLQNAPHDSICGCSIDEVHQEMEVRFSRCRQTAEAVLEQALGRVAAAACPPGTPHLVVFNSEGGPRTDIALAQVPLRDGLLPLLAEAEDGTTAPLQLLEVDEAGIATVAMVASQVPGHGLRAFRIHYGPSRPHGRRSRGRIENRFFMVAADPRDGTIVLLDKRTGRRWEGLHRLVDSGDSGDVYNYAPPQEDHLVISPARPPRIRVVAEGPAIWTLEISMVYMLPASLTADDRARSPQRVPCPITTRIHLYADVPRVDFETEVENHARDHRLRVLFPTGLRSPHVLAEQHLGPVHRPPDPRPFSPLDFEMPVATQPQKAFCAVEEEGTGILLANRGLPEYEALREPDGTITLALTLLRCVGWLSRPELYPWRRGPAGPLLPTPGAQMLGRWRFHYSLVPYQGSWEDAMAQAYYFLRPLRAIPIQRGDGVLPPSASLLEVEPAQVMVSAIKPAEDDEGIVVRIYNPTHRSLPARLRLAARPRWALEVNLNEEAQGAKVELGDGWLETLLPPQGVRTFKFFL